MNKKVMKVDKTKFFGQRSQQEDEKIVVTVTPSQSSKSLLESQSHTEENFEQNSENEKDV